MSQDFPRVYRLSLFGRYYYYVFGVFFVAFFGAGGVYLGWIAQDKERVSLWAALLILAFAACGVLLILAGRQVRVLLYPDAIESVGVFMTRRMTRANIHGYRWIQPPRGSRQLWLFARYDTGHKLRLPQYLDMDADFKAWFDGIENLDAREQQASLDEVLSATDVYGTKQERLARLAKAKRVAKALYWISLGAVGWVWIHPQPYLLAVGTCVLLPWVAVVMAAQDSAVYRLSPKQNDAGANLLPAMLLPGCALLVRALIDISVFDWQEMLWLMAAASAVCGALMGLLVPELRKNLAAIGLLAVVVVPYAYGTVDIANAQLDRRAPVPYVAQVLDQHVSRGRTTSYELTLAPWGPRSVADDAQVTKALYGSVSKGDRVCVYLHPGSLGVRWFEVWACPRG